MPTGGRDFLRLMNDQSRRAADFDHRMRWAWMRKELSEVIPAEPVEPVLDEDVLDLRPTEELAEPPLAD